MKRTWIAMTAALGLWGGVAASGAEPAVVVPPPLAVAPSPDAASSTLVVAGGCFWGVQGVFQHVKGVVSAVSGYAGGPKEQATYAQVSSGRTGHAEAVQITYDPRRIDAGTLLRVFFSVVHDPTQRDRQGPDVGTQYRSAVFTGDAPTAAFAREYIGQLDKAAVFRRPIATTIEPLGIFVPAEAYHQDYLTLHPDSLYISVNDLPKIEALKRLFPDLYRDAPVLVSATH